MLHANNLTADRKIGEYWERQFCIMAGSRGLVFTPMQIGRSKSAQYFANLLGKWKLGTLPDITIWSSPGEHHEIKHKEPTRYGAYGLEVYRLQALLDFAEITGQTVLYTIHNHKLNGGRDIVKNHPEHWFTAEINYLNRANKRVYNGFSYVNGTKKTVPICYWASSLWVPLAKYWDKRL